MEKLPIIRKQFQQRMLLKAEQLVLYNCQLWKDIFGHDVLDRTVIEHASKNESCGDVNFLKISSISDGNYQDGYWSHGSRH